MATHTGPTGCGGVIAIIVVESTNSVSAIHPSNTTCMPGSKPMPVSVTRVPPASGPADGETALSTSPSDCAKCTVFDITWMATLRETGSGLYVVARNESDPEPTPIGGLSRENQ